MFKAFIAVFLFQESRNYNDPARPCRNLTRDQVKKSGHIRVIIKCYIRKSSKKAITTHNHPQTLLTASSQVKSRFLLQFDIHSYFIYSI
ncbi:hypothetical protein F8A88_03620 [Pseudodesulfovibrio senegalensis]|uniref:Uncharacterized protein n=1 Tax=Pseudodesulfovibrio senegalensis TaxID=1721087 RepID=A0A6N6N8X0_9BACT|nr:hypothetical protein F8A88_03620 [Pseudodesulfovibrio senegalensis]